MSRDANYVGSLRGNRSLNPKSSSRALESYSQFFIDTNISE